MTEEEAKTKTCWRSIGVAPVYAPDGGGIRDGGPWPCVGSDCMAWRWLPSGDNRDKIEAIRAHREKHGSDLRTAKEAVEASWSDPKERGFCGLAGAPR